MMRPLAYAATVIGGLAYLHSPPLRAALAAEVPSWAAPHLDAAMLVLFAVVIFGVASSYTTKVITLDLTRLDDDKIDEMRVALGKLPGLDATMALAKSQSLMSAISAIDTGAATVQRAVDAIASAGEAVVALDAQELRRGVAAIGEAVRELNSVSSLKVDPGLAERLDEVREQLDKIKELADEYDLDELSENVEKVTDISRELTKLRGGAS